MEVFVQNIEQVILENFDNAKKSIVIVVAWFTNPKIISKLIELKKYRHLDIQIIVDENEINKKYFFEPHLPNLEKVGVDVKRQHLTKFNHNKFSIIDNETIITGSYNYTNKANKNFENIVIEHDAKIADFYSRIFKFFSDKNYRDPNLAVLSNNLEIGKKMISTYYPFSPKLFSKIKDKINLGYCFTHENGFYNEISYEPGLVFNPKYTLHKKLLKAIQSKEQYQPFPDINDLSQEFVLPITKDLIKNYQANELKNYNFQIVQEIANFDLDKIDFEDLADSFEKTEIALTHYYTRKFKTIFTLEELNLIFKKKFDIIIEDYIWVNNFAPFLTDSIVEEYFTNIKPKKVVSE